MGEQILLAGSMSSISGICTKKRYHARFLETFRHGPALASMLHAQTHGCMGHLDKLL